MTISRLRADLYPRARKRGVRAIRALSLHAARVVGRVADPVPLAGWLVSGARDPRVATRRAVMRIAALTTPEPEEVVANYLRGLLLLGLPGRDDVRFMYHHYPLRGIIDAESAHVPKRDRRSVRSAGFEIRFDEDLEQVMDGCRREEWTWITDDITAVYRRLFDRGFATCIGVYADGELVGGVWGLLVGRTFSAMSTFHRVSHAGSASFIAMIDAIGPDSRWDLIDLGVHKGYVERFGAHGIPVEELTTRVLDGLVTAESRRTSPLG